MIEPKPPTIMAMAGESLTPLELPRLLASSPALALQARGTGEPVLVLPGLGASNTSTAPMRRYLSWLGYDVHGWRLGQNNGDVAGLLPLVVEQLNEFYEDSCTPVNLVGWSLGGVLAREAARDNPGSVRQVVTMGSPVVGGPKYTSLGRIYAQRGQDVDAIAATVAERENTPIRVPVTSIYSKRDGIVGWQASIDRLTEEADNIEVCATHFGLGFSPAVYKILARKLAQS